MPVLKPPKRIDLIEQRFLIWVEWILKKIADRSHKSDPEYLKKNVSSKALKLIIFYKRLSIKDYRP